MQIASVGRAFPENYYDQSELLAALKTRWGDRFANSNRLEQLHRNVLVDGRHLALSIAEYDRVRSFADRNDAYIRCAVDLGAQAIRDGLARLNLPAQAIDHIFFVSVTGLAVPSIDARLVNRLELRSDIKRTPIFGLGCVAGAAGIARAADYLKAYPDQVAVLLSVELCSLTLQLDDFSVRNLIASGLFGDGAAAVVLAGNVPGVSGPRIIDSCSVFHPNTEDAMGWTITEKGFRIVLSGEVPNIARRIRGDVDRFLATHDLTVADIGRFVCHPGGPKVLRALAEALEVDDDAFAVTWESLRRLGNLSSASVLMVLEETLRCKTAPGTYGLMLAMGPGFCSELVLLQW
jgi:alkylresorcinol/alkylpyrone synthase